MNESPITTRMRQDLRHLMKKKHINGAQLSRMADVSISNLYAFLGGRANITTGTLDKLFRVLEVL